MEILISNLKNEGASDTKDSIYILSVDEARNWGGTNIECEFTDFVELGRGSACVSWTRTTDTRSRNQCFYHYNDDGFIFASDIVYHNYGVRPTFRLSTKGVLDKLKLKEKDGNLSIKLGEFPQKRVDNVDKNKMKKTSQIFLKNTKIEFPVYKDKDGRKYVFLIHLTQ